MPVAPAFTEVLRNNYRPSSPTSSACHTNTSSYRRNHSARNATEVLSHAQLASLAPGLCARPLRPSPTAGPHQWTGRTGRKLVSQRPVLATLLRNPHAKPARLRQPHFASSHRRRATHLR